MKNRPGMTLLEVVVALAVGATALAAGSGALAMIAHRSGAAEEVAGAAVEHALVRQTITDWLVQARVGGAQAVPSFEGVDGEYEGRPDDALMFLTSAPTPLNVRETVVMLYIDRDEATLERGLTAVLMPWQGTSAALVPQVSSAATSIANRVLRMELVPQATTLDIRYRSGLLAAGGWLPSWISTTVPPSAIELTIEGDVDAPLPPLLRLPLRASVRSIR